MAKWKEASHNGYTVSTYTLKTYSHSVSENYTPEFTIPPGTDFTVICNYGATDLSSSAHVEMFYSDVPGGTFKGRTKSSGYWFNATSAIISDAGSAGAAKTLPQNISTVMEHPRYKMKVTGASATAQGGGLVKFVIYYARGVTW